MRNIFIGMFVSVLIILALAFNWGYNQTQELNRYNVYVENQFQRMFYNLVGNVEDIQSNLAKVMVTGTPKQNVLIFTNLMYKAYDAQEKLTQLPINHKDAGKTQKFLSQVGDLSMAMARKNLRGITLTQEDMGKLEELHNYANYLARSLIELQGDIANNGTKLRRLMGKAGKNLKETNKNMINTSFLNVEERMQEYPELIYDGPFSEHIANIKPKLEGENISKDKAMKVAKEFLKDKREYEATFVTETDNTRLPAYIFELRDQDNKESYISIAITKKVGKPLWMFDTKPVGNENISKEKAIQIAQDFLKKNGFENMVSTYTEEYDGQIIINFAYKDGEVIVYTDLIKVKVSLEDGTIKGFEAEGYLTNHHNRTIPKTLISEKEAKNMISIGAEVKEVRLAIIPTEGSKEILCYEFLTKYKEDDFLVYVNALNGEEEKILQMIIKEKGVLMM